MDIEARKAGIRRRVTLMRLPRRHGAPFTDENDHNPMVLQDCPGCLGSGRVSEYWADGTTEYAARVACADCGGSGVTGAAEPYFPEEWPEAQAKADAEGWLTCPRCNWRFTTRDPNAWTGRRHLRCGQKIRPLAAPAGRDAPAADDAARLGREAK